MMKRFLSIFLAAGVLFIGLLAPSILQAKAKPEITRCDVQFLNMNNSVNVSVHWQSSNPVTMVRIYLGREPKEIQVDEYDNRRNPHGYSGEVTTVIPLDQAQAESLAYSVQIEDDLRQKSDQAIGKITLVKRGERGDDSWGRDDSRSILSGVQSGQQAGRSEIVDKLIGAMDRFDLAPSVAYIKTSYVVADRVNFNIRITDDKNLSQLMIRILDGSGNRVQEQVVSNISGKFWEGYSSTFTLPIGNYKVSAVAVDAGGNASKEKIESFAVTQSVSPAAAPEPTTVPYITAGQPTTATPTTTQPYTTSDQQYIQQGVAVPTTTDQQMIQQGVPNVPPATPAAGTQDASQTGFVMTAIQPADAVNAGAMWRVDGGQWQMAGMAVSGLTAGQHTIEFNDVAGWIKPVPQAVSVQPSQVVSIEGTYKK